MVSSYSTNEFRSGLKVMLDGAPCAIIENEFVKPGKGQAFNRVKLRHLKTGRVLEKTFKSGDRLDAADVIEVDMEFLYADSDAWHFMDPNSFEQISALESVVGEAKNWLKPQNSCTLTLYNGVPLLVDVPNFVTLQITQSDPGIKGDTAQGATKPAVLETGAEVRVPLFVEEGEWIKVDTRKKEYVSRVKDL